MTAPVLLNKSTSAHEATLHLYGVIGLDITTQAVSEALQEAKGVKRLNVFCDSPGGELFAGFTLLAQLERFAKTAEVVFTVDGLCASAATIVAMGATRVVATPTSTWMVHEARAIAGGTAADHAKMAELLAQESSKLVALYARKTGQAPEAIAELLAAEKYLTAQDALEAGFVDEILSEAKPKPRNQAPVVRVEDAARDLRLAAMRADALRIRSLSNAASRGGAPGKPGQPNAQDPKESP
jgi:ATP-dependent protease ClpP protease subunit